MNSGLGKALAAGIVWIGSSIAGLSAILYGIGFLVEHSHLNLLGVLGPSIPAIDYLKTGARFIVQNVTFISWNPETLGLLLLPVLVCALTLSELRRECRDVLCRALTKRGLARLSKVPLWFWSAITAAASVAIVILALQTPPEFLLVASVNNLLLPAATASSVSGQPARPASDSGGPGGEFLSRTLNGKDVVASEIRSGDPTARYARYQHLLTLAMAVLNGVILVWLLSTLGRQVWRATSLILARVVVRIALIALGAVAVLDFLMLPVAAGKLLVPNEYPSVVVIVGKSLSAADVPSSRVFLMLMKTETEIIVYDREHPIWQSILILDRAAVGGIRIIGTDQVF
jgi:hypothetical protein